MLPTHKERMRIKHVHFPLGIMRPITKFIISWGGVDKNIGLLKSLRAQIILEGKYLDQGGRYYLFIPSPQKTFACLQLIPSSKNCSR